MSLVQLKAKDLKGLRHKWWEDNNQCCPILKRKFPVEDMVIDHQHKLKGELPDETGKGIIRGCIHFQANALEGKITNAFKRLGLNKHVELTDFLRNLADYLERNYQHDEIKFIHPKEEPKPKKLTKTSYNKLSKLLQKQGKRVPKYSGNLTKELSKLFEQNGIEPEFYS